MKKILIIAYRDFSIRIRNKTFLISTLLLPLGIFFFYGAIFLFTSNDFETYRIGVKDADHHISSFLKTDENFQFIDLESNFNQDSKQQAEKYNLNAVLNVPESLDEVLAGKFNIVSYSKIGLLTKGNLEDKLQSIVERQRFAKLNIDSNNMQSIQKPIDIFYRSIDGKSDSELKEGISYGLGFGLGILMYMILTIYGAQVMRGVMEEKTNRIVEIIISSVRPFELLLGKIIGIGMVSVLQLILWATLILLINLGVGLIMGGQALDLPVSSGAGPSMMKMASDPDMLKLLHNLQSIDFLPIVGLFIFYFLGGFFLYSALFAAVGSAVNDDPQDVQQLMLPIMMPIILSFIFLTKAINNPNGTAAVISSIVPFTAPVVMISRVVFGIPEGVSLWQLILSMVTLVVTTIFLIFLAARIYKVGILLYGKKVGWKDMVKWIFIN